MTRTALEPPAPPPLKHTHLHRSEASREARRAASRVLDRRTERLVVHAVEGFSRSQIAVSRLNEGDWQELRALRLRALAASPEAFFGDLGQESEYDEQVWRVELISNIWIIARSDGRGIGLAKLNHAVDQVDGMHLEALWVDPESRRQKVGERLVSEVENIASEMGAEDLKLWIFVGNDDARSFYLKMGYATRFFFQPLEVNGRQREEEEFKKKLLGVDRASAAPVEFAGTGA